MPRKTAPIDTPFARSHTIGRAWVFACAISALPLAQTALPQTFQPFSIAQAQQLPDAATQELFLAVDRNDMAGVRAAIDKGADIEARDFTGTQPVDMAIDRGYFEIAKYLISVRNLRQDKKDTLPELPELAAPTPDAAPSEAIEPPLEQLAETPPPTAPPAAAADAPADPFALDTTADPFEAVEAADELPVLDDVQESAPTAEPEQPLSELDELDAFTAVPEQVPEAPPPAAAPEELAAPTELPEPPMEVADPFAVAPEPPTTLAPPAAPELPAAPEMDAGPEMVAQPEAPTVPEPPAVPEPPMPTETADLGAESADPFDPAIPADAHPLEEAPQDASDDVAPGDAAPDVSTAQTVVERAPEPEPSPEPEPEVVTELAPAPEAKPIEVAKAEKPSAAKRFVTTFFDFFKPPNVTGVVRREDDRTDSADSLSEEELTRQLRELEAEQGNVTIRGPEVPISPEELARELPPSPEVPDLTPDEIASAPTDTPSLPPYSVGSPAIEEPKPAEEDVFGDLAIEEVTEEEDTGEMKPVTREAILTKPDFKEAPGVPGRRFNPDLPFGGGVDPDILAYLNLDPRTGLSVSEQENLLDGDTDESQMAATSDADDPFATLEGAEEESPFDMLEETDPAKVSDLLEGLDSAEDVAVLEAKPAPSRADEDPFATDDPFASDDPFATAPEGEVDELAGLLEGVDDAEPGTDGWDVTKVEGADLPSEMIVLSDIEPTGEILDGIELTIGSDTKIGQEVGQARLELMELDTIHKPCLSKGGKDVVFCVDKVSWPFELEDDFLVDTIMYQGTRAIARYDAGRASNFHTLFRTEAFNKVINHYTQRYGQPSEIVERAIAPLAAPRQENPTYLWQSREPGTDTITTLEIRKFDDAQGGGFPDTKRGVILLYRAHAKSIFPQLSQLELMVLKADSVAADSGAGDFGGGGDVGGGPASPESIW